jgi:type II secretion system protein H
MNAPYFKAALLTRPVGYSSRIRRNSGFTLIEMMMVVAVAGLLLSGVVLNVLPQVRQSWVEEAAASMGANCQEARSMALSDNRPVVVTLDTSDRTLTLWKDQNQDEVRDADEEEVIQLSTRNGVTITTDWTSGVFTPAGRFMELPMSRTLSTVETTFSSTSARSSRSVKIQGSGAVEVL